MKVILLLLLIGPGGQAQTLAAVFPTMAECTAARETLAGIIPDDTVRYAAACTPLITVTRT